MLRREDGFSLLEIVIAAALMLLVTASVFSMMGPAHGSFATEPEVADLQQRLRVAADTLSKDLIMAGAGAYLGTSAGSLGAFFAPVLPFRQGATSADPAGTFAADRITLMYVPSTAAQTTLSADLTPISLTLQVNTESGCPQDVNLCGFTRGMSVLVYDDTGTYDMFTITSVSGASAQVAINRPADTQTRTYEKDVTKVVEAVSHTYYLKPDEATQTSQLMHYDGTSHADVPVVDHLVSLRFDYYGDPNPPVLKKPVSDPTGPWTTYGPKPPALRAKPTAYPAGENCTFTIDGDGLQIPRLAVLGGGNPTLVNLTPAQLTDGPWCPDEANPNRWDADLLRIRKVAVTLRVETAAKALRGPAGVLFTHGGTSRGGSQWVPDQEIRFQVTPRNLNLGR
jgi:hypothetical protein